MTRRFAESTDLKKSQTTVRTGWTRLPNLLNPILSALLFTPFLELHATSTVQNNVGYYLRRSRMTHCKVKGIFLKEEVLSSENDRVVWKLQITEALPNQNAPCPEKNSEIQISVPQGQYRTYDGKVIYSESIEVPKPQTSAEMALSQTTTMEGVKRWLIQSNFVVGSPSQEK